MSSPSASAPASASTASLLLASGRHPLLQFQSLRAHPTKPPFHHFPHLLLPVRSPLSLRSASRRCAARSPVPLRVTPPPGLEAEGAGGWAAAVRRVAVALACGALAAAWCHRALAVAGTGAAGASGAVEAAAGFGGMALRGSWPRVLQILQLLREQGIILALLLGLSAFFSMAETSITTLWPWKVRELAEKEPENGVFRMLRSDVTRFLTTILIGTTVVNIGATAIVTEAATAMFGEAGVSAATGVMTVAILLLTEITPKSVAVHNATDVARFVVRPVAWLSLILYPVGRIVTFLSMGMLKILGLKGRSEPYVTEDELKLMLRGAELSGAIAEDEQDMIENVLEIKDTHVREVMTPLVDVVAIDATATLIDFKNLWETHQYSRVPVFEERIDNIVGIAYAMDMLEYVEEVEKLKEITVKEIAHMPTYFVPDSMSVWNLLREFRIRQVHMAVVLNEYGGTIGIVTLEDVVEEIVGEIFDENDSKEEIQKKTGYIVMRDDGTFDVDANTSIDHLSEELGVKIPEGHQYETVSGFVCESFGYIPEEGGKMLVILEKDNREENDEYKEEGSDHQDDRERTQAYELEILEANARKVGKVRFKPISSECVDVDCKGVNRMISKKIIKRKKQNPDDSSDSDDEECDDISENGCPADLLYYSDDNNSAQLEDAGNSAATRSMASESPRSWKVLNSQAVVVVAGTAGSKVAAVMSRRGLHGYNSSGWKNHFTGGASFGPAAVATTTAAPPWDRSERGASIWRSLSSRSSLILSSSLNLCCRSAMEENMTAPSLLCIPIKSSDDDWLQKDNCMIKRTRSLLSSLSFRLSGYFAVCARWWGCVV
uniref:CNNM transmembrane domain-containing protein n=2 Tax=Leersia perrieri TaxID=77586 RepID=A0A0D9VW05_9ORYZ